MRFRLLRTGACEETKSHAAGCFEIAALGKVRLDAFVRDPLPPDATEDAYLESIWGTPRTPRAETREVEVGADEHVSVDLALVAPGLIAVDARYEDGQAVRGREVNIWGGGELRGLDDEGDRALWAAQPGRYFVSLGPDVREVEVREGAEVALAFVLPGPSPPRLAGPQEPVCGTVSARVVEPEGTVARLHPRKAIPEPYLLAFGKHGRHKGTFFLHGEARVTVPAGRYELLLSSWDVDPMEDDDGDALPHPARAPPVTVEVVAGQVTEATLRPVGWGTITVSATGVPEGVTPSAELDVILPSGRTVRVDDATLEAESGFGATFRPQAAGLRYRVSITNDFYAGDSPGAEFDLAPGEERAITLAMRPRYPVLGEIRFDAKGIRQVELTPEGAWRSVPMERIRRDDNPIGDIVGARLPPGRYEVYIWFQRLDPEETETYRELGFVDVPAGDAVSVRVLEAGRGSIFVFVRSRAAELPLSKLLAPDGHRYRGGTNCPVTFGRLPPGRYELLVGDAAVRTIDLGVAEHVDLGIIDVP